MPRRMRNANLEDQGETLMNCEVLVHRTETPRVRELYNSGQFYVA